MDAAQPLDRTPAVLALGGRQFAIMRPENRDMLAVRARMVALAQAKCLSPVDYAATHAHLPAPVFAALLGEALKLGAGGGVKPHPDAVWDEYDTLEGVRFRVWYHASRAHKDLKPEEVAALVTEDNLFDAAEALSLALRFGELDPGADAKKNTPGTGTSSPPPSPGPTSSANSPAAPAGTPPPS
jgi:hypothetical protein